MKNMKNGTRWTIGLLAALSLASGSAWAAHHEGDGEDGQSKGHHGRHHGKMFEKKDADQNGEISRAEWMADAEERFARMDADGSGAVTQEEMKDAHKRMREGWKKKSEGEDS